MELTDKVVVVTGGANGIGRATVARLARSGATVAIWDRQPEGAEQTVSALLGDGCRVFALAVDVSDRAAVTRAAAETAERGGGIDVGSDEVAVRFG